MSLKEKIQEQVRKKEAESTTYQEPGTHGSLVAVREGIFALPGSTGSPEVKITAANIPNLEKAMERGEIKRVAGRKSRRSRKPKHKKNRLTRRRK